MATLQEMQAELERLKADNERLRAKGQAGALSVKIGEKLGIVIGGMGKFPVTMYPLQLVRFCKGLAKVIAFTVANADRVAWGKADDSIETCKANRETALAYFRKVEKALADLAA